MAPSKTGNLPISKEAEEILASDPQYMKLARASVEDYAKRLRDLDRLVARSTMTEDRAVELGKKARKGVHSRLVGK